MAQRAAQAVRPVRAEEHAAAIAVLTKSFAHSPFGLWLYPDTAIGEREFTALFASYLAKPTAVVDVTDDLRSVAVWTAPAAAEKKAEAEQDETYVGTVHAEAAALFAAVDAAEPKAAGAWYLAFLGSLGKGGGSALIQHRLGLIGEAPASLWTPAEGLVPFYGRFGFELLSRHDVDGASAFWMTRAAALLAAEDLDRQPQN